MPTCCQLVYLPALPFDAACLMPQQPLALAAACLVANGHAVHVRDYGVLGALGAMPASRSGLPGFGGRWNLRAARAAAERSRAGSAAVETLAERPDLVYLHVPRPADWVCARGLAERLRASAPGLLILAGGDFVAAHGARLLKADERDLSALCLREPEYTLRAAADALAGGRGWRNAPNLALPAPGGPRVTGYELTPSLDLLPPPCHDPEVYPAARDASSKFLLYTIEDSRGRAHPRRAEPVPPHHARPVRVKSPSRVCDELRGLRQDLGARAFHFPGQGTPAAQVDSLAFELLARGAAVRYSRAADPRLTDPAALSTLHASGCRAIGFQLDTGSQRLLDDYYGGGFGVGHALNLLRNCARLGIAAHARLTYPCPEDDRHTRAETQRLLRLGLPASAAIALPEPLPGSRWFEDPGAHGFILNAARHDRWVQRGGGAALPIRMRGMTSRQALREQAQLAALTSAEGIAAGLSEQELLVAHLTGEDAALPGFAQSLGAALLACDAEALAARIAAFNREARSARNTVAFRPYRAARTAVGN